MSRDLFRRLATEPVAGLPLPGGRRRWTNAELDEALRPLGWIYVRMDPGLRWLLLTTELKKRPLVHEAELKKRYPYVSHPILQLLDSIWLRLEQPRGPGAEERLRNELRLGPGTDLALDGMRHLGQLLAAHVTSQQLDGRARRGDPWAALLHILAEQPRWADLLESELFGPVVRRVAIPALTTLVPAALARYVLRAW